VGGVYLRTSCTNRLNAGNNGRVRNVSRPLRSPSLGCGAATVAVRILYICVAKSRSVSQFRVNFDRTRILLCSRSVLRLAKACMLSSLSRQLRHHQLY